MRYTSPPVTAPLALHPQSSTIILPSSHPSSLQEYSPSSGKLISELEVSPSNRVSRRDEKPLEHARVERVVVSPSGEWMATIDGRDGDDTLRGEIYLKIWQLKSGNWILNTRIDRPHGHKRITAIAFSPTRRGANSVRLVTTALDGNAKTWRIRSLRGKNGELEGLCDDLVYFTTVTSIRHRILGSSVNIRVSVRISNARVVVSRRFPASGHIWTIC
jgi:NET1-associated nuclear protein 1 (U3 small nucleolar RNA-associated protein 17)